MGDTSGIPYETVRVSPDPDTGIQSVEEDQSQDPAEADGEESAQCDSYKTHVTETQLQDYDLVLEQFPSQLSEDVPQDVNHAASPKPSSQLASMIPKRFERPVSSHEDRAKNPAFGKAAPPPNWNLGRNMNRYANFSNPYTAPPPPVKISETLSSHDDLEGTGTAVVTHGTSFVPAKDHLAANPEVPIFQPLQGRKVGCTEKGRSSPETCNAANDGSIRTPKATIEQVPPNIHPEEAVVTQTEDLNNAVPQDEFVKQAGSSEAIPAQDVVQGAVPGNLSPQTRSLPPRTHPEKLDYAYTLQQIVQPLEARESPRSPSNKVLSPSHGNSVQGEVDGNGMNRGGVIPHAPTRVTKTRKKSKPVLIADASGATFPPAGIQANLSDEELVGLLLSRYKREQEHRRAERAKYQEKVAEANGLREAADTLYHRLQETREREDAQKTEISKYRTIMPKWEAKIRNLTHSVKGLHADHQNLQVEAQAIKEQQVDIVATKCDIEDSLRDARHSAKQGNAEAKKLLREARHRVDILEQTVEHQEMQLQEDSDLMDAERERSQHLQQEIEKIRDSHQQLSQLFMEERQNLTEKMDELISKNTSIDFATSPDFQDQTKATLDHCVSLLEGLDDTETVQPRHLHELSSSMNSYAKRLSRSLQICVGKLTASEIEQKAFATRLEQQLFALGKNTETEPENAAQVMELQEIKATIKERLRMTEAALAEARRDAITQGAKEQMLQQKLMKLEMEATTIRNGPPEIPQVNPRIEELESRNSELQAAMETSRLEALQVSEDLQRRIAELQTSADEAQTQRDKAMTEVANLNQERSTLAAEAEAQLEETRRQLAKAANIEQARLTGQHVNSVRQLRQQLEGLQARAAELRPLQEEKDYIQARAEQDSRQHADEMRRIVQENKTIRAKSDEYMQQLGDLQLDLAALETRFKERDVELKDLKQQKEAEEAKTDAQIKQLQQEREELLSRVKSAVTPARQPEVREALQTPSRDRADLAKSEIERARQGQKLTEVEEKLRVMTDRLHSSDAQIQMLQEQAKFRGNIVATEPGATQTPDKPRRKANRNARPSSEQHVNQSLPFKHDTSEAIRLEEVSLLASAPRRLDRSSVQSVLPLSHFPQEIPERSKSPFPDWEGLFPPTPSQFGEESQELTTYETQRSRTTSSSQGFSARESQELMSISSTQRFVPKSRDGKGESQELMTAKSQKLRTTSALRNVGRDAQDSPTGRINFPRQSVSKTHGSPRPMSKDQTKSSSIGDIPRSQGRVLPIFGGGSSNPTSSSCQPKGILKAPKRDAIAAGLPPAGTMNGKPKFLKGDKGLGPVIADPQSPSQNIPRNQRQTRILRKSTKDYQMTRRFSQEFE